jgi:hypothetical protein
MKVLLGPMVARASGKIGGAVASSNRYGTYMRRNAKPTVSTTPYAQKAKSDFARVSQTWDTLSVPQMEAWRVWAANNPIVDRLGEKQVLAGNAAFGKINGLIAWAGGTLLKLPPAVAAPLSLESLTLSGDIGAGAFGATFAATPLATGIMLLLWACVTDRNGVVYVDNMMRLVAKSEAALATPWDFQSALEARFGTLQVGQEVHVTLTPWDMGTGLMARGTSGTVTVTSTP